jgi:hypothetical protein
MLVRPSLPPTHGTGRDHTDEIITDGQHNEEEPAYVRLTQRIIPSRALGALLSFDDHQRTVEKHLLSFTLGHSVLNPILLCITLIPLEPSALCKVIYHDHRV